MKSAILQKSKFILEKHTHSKHSITYLMQHKINLPGESGGSPVTRLNRRDKGIYASLSIVESCFRLLAALEREKMSQESVSTQTISDHTRMDARNTVHTPHTQRTCKITRT